MSIGRRSRRSDSSCRQRSMRRQRRNLPAASSRICGRRDSRRANPSMPRDSTHLEGGEVTDTDNSVSDLAVILGLLRRVRNWLQADVATAAKVPASAVSDYERGKKTPSLRVLRRVVSGMGFKLSAIEETQAFLIGLRRRHGIPSAADRL